MKLTHSTVEVKIDDKTKMFSFWHNMEEHGNINTLQSALDNWLARTSVYTEKAFCKYVIAKNTDFVCYTNYQYYKLKQTTYGNTIQKSIL